MTRGKTNTFYFINDFKFKHVSFDKVEKTRPFKGENPIIRDKFQKKKKSNLKISSRICYFFECLMKYHTHVCFKRKRKLFVKYGYFKIVVYFMFVFYFVDSLKHLAGKNTKSLYTLAHLRTLRSKIILHKIPRFNSFVIIIHFFIQKQTKSLDKYYIYIVHYTLDTFIILH